MFNSQGLEEDQKEQMITLALEGIGQTYGRAQSIRGDATFVQVVLDCVRKQAVKTSKRCSLMMSPSVPVSNFLLWDHVGLGENCG